MNDKQKEVSKEQEVQPVRQGKPTRSSKTGSVNHDASSTKNGTKRKEIPGKGTSTSKEKKGSNTGPSAIEWKLEMRELREEIRDNQKRTW